MYVYVYVGVYIIDIDKKNRLKKNKRDKRSRSSIARSAGCLRCQGISSGRAEKTAVEVATVKNMELLGVDSIVIWPVDLIAWHRVAD